MVKKSLKNYLKKNYGKKIKAGKKRANGENDVEKKKKGLR